METWGERDRDRDRERERESDREILVSLSEHFMHEHQENKGKRCVLNVYRLSF